MNNVFAEEGRPYLEGQDPESKLPLPSHHIPCASTIKDLELALSIYLIRGQKSEKRNK
jgi:hypothetical protein